MYLMKGSFFVSESKKNKKSKFNPPVEISVNYSVCNPDSCEEQVNVYGTYEIQPTANTENDFPAIAQGETPQMKKRTHKFFRGEKDPNPASEWADKDCVD